MKIFAYALREYDEKAYMEDICSKLGVEYAYTSEYPSLENIELARGYEGISIITNPMDPELLDALHKVGAKYISTRSIGYDHIDVDYAHQLGMKVCHVTYSPNSVANYTIMMMLMACRKIDYIMAKTNLQDFSLEGKIGKELSLSTVGVVGTGQIGETVIRHLHGFGCKILAYDLNPKESLREMATYVDLDTLYAESDIITLHVPGCKENLHMICEETIAKMKEGVILVNAARGSLVDTPALIRGLETGRIAFAALDTFENEKGLFYLNYEKRPLANQDFHMLKAMPNVMLSPHMAFYTDQAVSDMVGNSVKGLLLCEGAGENPFEVLR